MLKLITNCDECTHKNVCKHKDNAKNAMKKLSDITYGDGPNDDYSWEIMMEVEHVDISFSCHDFMKPGNLSYPQGIR